MSDASNHLPLSEADFDEADPREVASQLDDRVIDLWRIGYLRAQGRASLQALLGAYLQVAPSELAFHHDAHGKPSLTATDAALRARIDAAALQFNWSHSGEHALIAVARGITPGVDIELLSSRLRVLDIAARFFQRGEADALAACDESEREIAFFQLWSCKEAVLKAVGRGLAFGLDRVAFAREANGWQPAQFDAEIGAVDSWNVRLLTPTPGYNGALAWRGPERIVRAWSGRS